jgi:site-specific DNA-adenine methylase
MIETQLSAPFPWFGGKSRAAELVWARFGACDNYVEPFAGSAAMLLARPQAGSIETINDADGFVANFWRAVRSSPQEVAEAADWPVNETDLLARHSWLVRRRDGLLDRLHGDPEYSDAKIAGWWLWGSCCWIGSGWCGGDGPWIHDGVTVIDSRQLPHLGNAGQGVNRQLPHLGDAGRGINRQLPHLGNAGRGINRQLPHLSNAGRGRAEFITAWMVALSERLRHVRVACGDWSRVLSESVTTRHGDTAVFLDPPYTEGRMDYAAGGVGGNLATAVRDWCIEHGNNERLRIALCGHSGEHDALLGCGWSIGTWHARKGYAVTQQAISRSRSETVWFSPACAIGGHSLSLFDEAD